MPKNNPQSPRHGRRQRRVWTKVLMSAGLITVAGAVVGAGAYASFTDTQAVSQTVGSGTLTLSPVGTSAVNNRLSIGAANIAPGDTIQRTVDVKDTGTIDLASVALTTTATTSSLLDTDATNGLQMVIDKCSVAWTETGTVAPFTYTCGGTTTAILTTRAVIQSAVTLTGLTLTAGTDNFLRVTLTLPTTAGNTFQGKSSVINYSLAATQRAGQAA
jgi:spore coat-associated protein N